MKTAEELLLGHRASCDACEDEFDYPCLASLFRSAMRDARREAVLEMAEQVYKRANREAERAGGYPAVDLTHCVGCLRVFDFLLTSYPGRCGHCGTKEHDLDGAKAVLPDLRALAEKEEP